MKSMFRVLSKFPLLVALLAFALVVLFAGPAAAQCQAGYCPLNYVQPVQKVYVQPLVQKVQVQAVQQYVAPVIQYAVPSVPLAAVVQQVYAQPVVQYVQQAVVQRAVVQKVQVVEKVQKVRVQKAEAPAAVQQRGLFNRVRIGR